MGLPIQYSALNLIKLYRRVLSILKRIYKRINIGLPIHIPEFWINLGLPIIY